MKKLVIVAMAVTCAFAVVALPTEAEPLSTVSATKSELDDIMLPVISIKRPATLVDAVNLLRDLSRKYDTAQNGKGVDFMLNIPDGEKPPAVPIINTRNIRLGDALKLIVRCVGYDFKEENGIMIVFKKK